MIRPSVISSSAFLSDSVGRSDLLGFLDLGILEGRVDLPRILYRPFATENTVYRYCIEYTFDL